MINSGSENYCILHGEYMVPGKLPRCPKNISVH